MRKLNKIITTAAMAAAILAGSTPKAAATGCPYTVGPLGRYIVPAQVQGMTPAGYLSRAAPDKATPPHTRHTAGTI